MLIVLISRIQCPHLFTYFKVLILKIPFIFKVQCVQTGLIINIFSEIYLVLLIFIQ